MSIAALSFLAACGPSEPRAPITVFAAASLAQPLAAIADTFAKREGVAVLRELGGSLELSRRMTDLGRVPDVLMLVDDNVVAALAPTQLDWYVRFATNRLGIAYTATSKFAESITSDNWYRIISENRVAVGRADPDVAPAGKLALGLVNRAESYYRKPHLTDTLLSRALLKYVRPNAAELAALLETGEVDFILDYESVARQYGFKFIALPEDLMPPVLYGVSVPKKAAHANEGAAFVAFLLSDAGKQQLRAANVNVLQVPVAVGTNLPSIISDRVRTLDTTAPVR
jgi:ABC-type molybdate transport system substrate-binding protein